MNTAASIDKKTYQERKKSLQAPGRVILRVYAAVVLKLQAQGKKGPTVRELAVELTADVAGRMTGIALTSREVEVALCGSD